MKRLFPAVAAAILAIGLTQIAYGFASAQSTPPAAPQATPAPQIKLPTTTSTKATPTPAPPTDEDAKRVGISGVWEVQIQQPSRTYYTHFKLDQNGTALTGQYLDSSGKKYPLQGTITQKDVHIIVTMADGTSMVFDGTVEANSDMAGTLDMAKDTVGFTAAYRPKYKWIDNLSPNPGIGTGNPGVP